MSKSVSRVLGGLATIVLLIVLLYVVWQPVFPSGLIIKKMADSIDPKKLSLEGPKVIRFELTGKGGGIYNIVADKDKGQMIEGNIGKADLIIYMEAKDFNGLMFSMALGSADEATFRRAVLSKVMRFAGDIGVFQLLFKR